MEKEETQMKSKEKSIKRGNSNVERRNGERRNPNGERRTQTGKGETQMGQCSLVTQSFCTDSEASSNRMLLFTDISTDGLELSCAVPNVGKKLPYGQKNRPENVNHVTACLKPSVEDANEEEETKEEETVEAWEKMCGKSFRAISEKILCGSTLW
ncbi:hypothetical protein TNIN_85811 [Trichonephila inaurata madagascariensis]|uniref:Uncharacterized protein n=1 Tax=Trichonephila inaurata madagascariensis TaxID=2747483 RepID=A0A8X6YAS1_9ARAC|nr:hypothetical protein TNIN_85811 [Trichonephila inaurata madagascariensis]